MPANTTTGRIVMSRTPKDVLDLAELIFKKHTTDGAASELKNLVDFDWNTTGPTIVTAQDFDKQAADFKGKMEEAYRQRDKLLKPIDDINKASAAYLKGKYRTNPKKLADWGFSVDDTPKAKKAPKTFPGS